MYVWHVCVCFVFGSTAKKNVYVCIERCLWPLPSIQCILSRQSHLGQDSRYGNHRFIGYCMYVCMYVCVYVFIKRIASLILVILNKAAQVADKPDWRNLFQEVRRAALGALGERVDHHGNPLHTYIVLVTHYIQYYYLITAYIVHSVLYL